VHPHLIVAEEVREAALQDALLLDLRTALLDMELEFTILYSLNRTFLRAQEIQVMQLIFENSVHGLSSKGFLAEGAVLALFEGVVDAGSTEAILAAHALQRIYQDEQADRARKAILQVHQRPALNKFRIQNVLFFLLLGRLRCKQ